MHNVLIIFYIAFSIGNLFILPELETKPRSFFFETDSAGETDRRPRQGRRAGRQAPVPLFACRRFETGSRRELAVTSGNAKTLRIVDTQGFCTFALLRRAL